MFNKFHKNDYKIKNDLKNFANHNFLGKILKPFFKDLYKLVYVYLPQPRDFLLKKLPKKGIFGEVGVYNGDFSQRIETICKPSELYLIDPWQAILSRKEEKYNQASQDRRYEKVVSQFRKQVADKRIHIVRQTSDKAVTDFSDNFFDFLYIDGDHSYEQVKKDINNYYYKVKSGGLLCGDDYNIDGVRKAVDEFVKNKNLQLEVKNFQFVIKK